MSYARQVISVDSLAQSPVFSVHDNGKHYLDWTSVHWSPLVFEKNNFKNLNSLSNHILVLKADTEGFFHNSRPGSMHRVAGHLEDTR